MNHYTITIKGHWKTWPFELTGTEEDAETWRRDGLTVHRVVNTVPLWVVDNFGWAGARAWMWAQDIWGVFR